MHTATFVGREKCKSCHKKEYDKWLGSDHDNAMDIANDTTVLGDFNNTIFKHNGITSRFFRKNNKFYIHTLGPDWKMDDFEIKYTFGIKPLQQYLIPFEGGRLQCLTIAWDVNKKKWYSLYPEENITPDDWLYWTNSAMTWNLMCAHCHSTNLKKEFDVETRTYNTTWFEIDVSCEACHGPGSLHTDWADLPEMARPETENYGLVVNTNDIDSPGLVEICARCHSRRSQIQDYNHFENDMMDNLIPELLNEGLYYPDGQILEEVYVYGSFVQSKMFKNNVKCNDCHDVHNLNIVKQGNALCLQCHRAATYNTKNHHFHKQKGDKGDPVRNSAGKVVSEVGEGAQCVKCHMPGRCYMGIDYRPDHSIRTPRPDLSLELKTPNPCNNCHMDKSIKWSIDMMTKWYGIGRKPHYGTILAEGRKGNVETFKDLVKLSDDQLFPVIARATALSLISLYPGTEDVHSFKRALFDDDSLMRYTAVRNFKPLDLKKRLNVIAPMLHDPVKAVRMEAAMNISEIPPKQLNGAQKKAFDKAIYEYIKAMNYLSDFPIAVHNLGILYSNQGKPDKAARYYKKAILIDKEFYPSKVNLAMYYNKMGQNSEAESLLREVLEINPDLYQVAYSLGLLLVEEKKNIAAVEYFKKAAKGFPGRARIHYNLGLLLQQLKRHSESEESFLKALKLEPENMDFLYALTNFFLKSGKLQNAKKIAGKMIEIHPSVPIGNNLLKYLNNIEKDKL